MEFEEEGRLEPMSPSAQYLKSPALSLCILGVLESEFPIDDSTTMQLLKHVFLPINPRFSSIVVTDNKGVKKWKKVEVNLKEHLIVPNLPSDMSIDYYDEFFTNYMSKIAMEELSPNRPLWEIHIIKYPTKNAAGNIIFKLHHSLGDGYSLMGALLSCLQRVDNPLMPLTFPSRKSNSKDHNSTGRGYGFLRCVPKFFSGLIYTVYDFGWNVFRSNLIEDDKSPIRSGVDGVEFRPIITCTTSFSIDHIKQIKSKLNVTFNDVITGIIIFGTRLYMQKTSKECGEAKCTSLVLFNTRAIGGYQSVSEMIKPESQTPWGNRFAFLLVSIPKLTKTESDNPIIFVEKAHRMIKRQKNSAAVYLTGQLLNLITKIRGPEATSRYIHGTLKNTSMAISNLIGPVEQMALAGQPIKGLYFAVAGPPQSYFTGALTRHRTYQQFSGATSVFSYSTSALRRNRTKTNQNKFIGLRPNFDKLEDENRKNDKSLSVTMVSYVGKLRIAMTMEKGFMDPNKFKSCIEYAFETIYNAALKAPSTNP